MPHPVYWTCVQNVMSPRTDDDVSNGGGKAYLYGENPFKKRSPIKMCKQLQIWPLSLSSDLVNAARVASKDRERREREERERRERGEREERRREREEKEEREPDAKSVHNNKLAGADKVCWRLSACVYHTHRQAQGLRGRDFRVYFANSIEIRNRKQNLWGIYLRCFNSPL